MQIRQDEKRRNGPEEEPRTARAAALERITDGVIHDLGEVVSRLRRQASTLREIADGSPNRPADRNLLRELRAVEEALAREAGVLLLIHSVDRGSSPPAPSENDGAGSAAPAADRTLIRTLTSLARERRGQSLSDPVPARRSPAPDPREAGCEVEILKEERTAIIQGSRIHLGARELELLETLEAHRGRVVSREILMERIWGRAIEDDRVLDAAIHRLRKKLGTVLPCPPEELIVTVRGLGYLLESGPSNGASGSRVGPVEAERPSLAFASGSEEEPGTAR